MPQLFPNPLSPELKERGYRFDARDGTVIVPWEAIPSKPVIESCKPDYEVTYHNAAFMPMRYKQTGAPVASGTKGQVRKISAGRKHRGMASDSL